MMRLNEAAQPAQHTTERIEQLVARRMVLLQFLQNLLRRPLGIDLSGHPLKLLLVGAQILVADLQQPVERRIHHLVIKQFLPISFRADAEIAVRARKQIVPQKGFVIANRVKHSLVAFLEIRPQRLVGHASETLWVHRP